MKRVFTFKNTVLCWILLCSLGLTLNAQTESKKEKTSTKKNSSEKLEKTTAKKDSTAKIPTGAEIFKPTIGLGTGLLSFYGDLYSKHAQSPWTSRIGAELHISQPLTPSFRLNFYVMFGKLGANERLGVRNENFESEIRLGGFNVQYDFSNFINPKSNIRPWISVGAESFEFLSKTDLKDANGNLYYYWDDGSIKNMPQTDPNAAFAIDLVRDYQYESDIRELNKDGFGKYQERSWAIPVGAGFYMNVGDRFHFKMGTTFHFTFTDYIDGISNKSIGDRIGTKAKDNFLMTSVSLHYDLVVKPKGDTLEDGYFDDVDFLAIDKEDRDGDGVRDWDDACHGTPPGVKVDAKGCPLDEDKDMIPDHRDDELPTPTTMIADGKGVGITDEVAQLWYDMYNDSTGMFAPLIDLDSAKRKGEKPKKYDPRKEHRDYTVELAKFDGGVPSDIMAYLLSVGDVRSIERGTSTVIYTAGTYDNIKTAMQRRDEFKLEGVQSATIGYFKGTEYFSMSDEEVRIEKEKIEKSIANSTGSLDHINHPDIPIYRVQLGAYKQKLSENMFSHIGSIVELKTDDGFYKYVSGGYKTLSEAIHHRVEVVLEGYPDAFVTAYKNGKRISLSEAGATVLDKTAKEDLNEGNVTQASVDKSFVTFSVQLGAPKKSNNQEFFDRIKDLKDVIKTPTTSGSIRVTMGSFSNYDEAMKQKTYLSEHGFSEAFVIGMFKGEIISIQEAIELLK